MNFRSASFKELDWGSRF